MSRTLYVSDLDGTLLNRQGKLSDFTVTALNGLISDGMLFTYATARSFTSAHSITRELRLELPVLVYNGGALVDGGTGERYESVCFKGAEVTFLREELRGISVSPIIYAFINGRERVSYLKNHVNEGMRYYLDSRKGDSRFRPVDSESQLYEGDIFYFTVIGEKETLVPLAECATACPEFHCDFQRELYRPEYWCEIMPADSTKAKGIEKLKQRLHCDRVVVFGDAMNDLPMFLAADECYAVSNAVPELKQAATAVIGSNEEDAVAKFLLSGVK